MAASGGGSAEPDLGAETPPVPNGREIAQQPDSTFSGSTHAPPLAAPALRANGGRRGAFWRRPPTNPNGPWLERWLFLICLALSVAIFVFLLRITGVIR